jgi:glycolate oxidase iron-sulfur subunit
MVRIETLTHLMGELEDQLVVCMKCGMCQAVCPVFSQTGREADVARGKLALLEGLMQAMLDDPEGVQRQLNKCLLCGSCSANCPSGVGVQEIFLKARAILAGYLGLSAAKRLILRGMLARPNLFDRLTEWGARFQKFISRPANDIIGTSCARVVSPLLQGRHFRPLAKVPFHRQQPSLDRPASTSGLKAALFSGCLIDKLFPTIARATLQVLAHSGVGLFLPGGQGCCGIPAISSGDLATFRKLVAHNLKCFSKGRFDYLITACATCTSTIREVWPILAATADQPAAAQLAAKTLDVSQFLVGKLGVPVLEQHLDAEKVVTYHDPCHLKKALKVAAEPRALIAANPAYRLVEMAEPDACCGMGGSFNLQYYEISRAIGRRKAEQIQATAAEVLATSCPACMVQISDMLSREGARMAIRHPVELYAEGLSQG